MDNDINQKEAMLLSIIIPVYNVEKHILDCLNSILCQLNEINRKFIEIILVNDKSPDRSMEVCDHLVQLNRDIFKTINHTENLGLGGARNSGIEIAKGKFITFLDSDDYYSPHAINYFLDRIKNSNELDIFIFGLEAVSDSKVIWSYIPDNEEMQTSSVALRNYSIGKITASACNKLFSSTVVKNIRFKERRYYEDLEFTCSALINADRVQLIPKVFYFYRQETTSITRQKIGIKHIEDLSFALFNMGKELNNTELYSNFFFNRWSFHLKKWELDKNLFTSALEEIVIMLDQFNLDFKNKFISDFEEALMKNKVKYKIESINEAYDKLTIKFPGLRYNSDNDSMKNRIEALLLEIEDLKRQKIWYETTYESLPGWWKMVGALLRRIR